MPIAIEGDLVRLEGVCPVEDAMPLIEFLRQESSPRLDLSQCTYLHTALWQLLSLGPAKLEAPPSDPFLARWLVPFMAAR